jgi:PAS domain S-box-containing protein
VCYARAGRFAPAAPATGLVNHESRTLITQPKAAPQSAQHAPPNQAHSDLPQNGNFWPATCIRPAGREQFSKSRTSPEARRVLGRADRQTAMGRKVLIESHDAAPLLPAPHGTDDADLRARARLLDDLGRLIGGAVVQVRTAPDGELTCLYASPDAAQRLGVAPADPEDPAGILRSIAPDDRPALLATMRAAAAQRRMWSHEFRLVQSDGSLRWVQARAIPHRDADDRATLWHGVVVDAPRRESADPGELAVAALEREKFFWNLFETLPLGLFVLDQAGNIKYANPAARNIWAGARYVGPEGYGEYVAWHAASGERVRTEEWAAVRALRDGVSVVDQEIEIEAFNGERRRILNSAFPIRGPQGELLGVLVANQDVTQQTRLQEQLIQSQKMEGLGQLAGGVAHDFNNILTAILGQAELARRGLPPDDPRRAAIEQIDKAAERAAAMTRQLLAFARKQIVRPRVLDISDVVRNLTPMLRQLLRGDIETELRLADAPLYARVDRTQLEQVILNLVVNARDAMPEGGRVTITTTELQLGEAVVAGGARRPAGHYVELTVADTGIGMDAKTQRRIFEPFFTTKPPGEGTGLGLATCFGIVQQAGGVIAVESAPGCGATFRVLLPRVTQDQPDAAAPAPAERLRGRETILLVEDDPAVRRVAVETLEDAGYRVLGAANGEEALEVLRDPAEPVHLLITDVRLPRRNGFVLRREAGALRPGLRALFISGGVEGAADSAAADDSTPLLCKPFTPEALLRQVRAVLDAAAPAVGG